MIDKLPSVERTACVRHDEPSARAAAGELCMLLVYSKAERVTIPANILKKIPMELEDGHS